jgi:hypothetical protein
MKWLLILEAWHYSGDVHKDYDAISADRLAVSICIVHAQAT